MLINACVPTFPQSFNTFQLFYPLMNQGSVTSSPSAPAGLPSTFAEFKSRCNLDESQKDEIGRLLSYLAENIQQKPEIIIRWFQPDRRKSGGVYQRARDRVVKIDDYRNEMTLEDGRIIPLRYIVELTLP